jgi:hypothetical protein
MNAQPSQVAAIPRPRSLGMSARKSDPSSGERLLLFVFLVLVIIVAARWVLSLWERH